MSESVTQTPGAVGTQGAGLPADGVNPANLSQTPAQAAVATSLVTDAGKVATPVATSLVTDAKDPTAVSRDADPAKNADGTPKTPEQIAQEAADAADAAKAKVVPEKYEIKFGDKEADPEALAAFTPIAKELGLTNDQAQKLASFHNEQVTALLASAHKFQTEDWNTQLATWRSEARADAEYGHLAGGKTFDENGALIAKGLATFGTAGLNKALIDSGMGNHPEVARFFYRVGKAVSEDTIRVGNAGSSGAPVPLANRLFPTMNQ